MLSERISGREPELAAARRMPCWLPDRSWLPPCADNLYPQSYGWQAALSGIDPTAIDIDRCMPEWPQVACTRRWP